MKEQRSEEKEIDLLQIMIKVLKILIKNTKIIIGITLIGIIIGIVRYSTKDVLYSSSVTSLIKVSPVDLVNKEYVKYIKDLLNGIQKLIEAQNFNKIAEKLNIEVDIAQSLIEIRVEEPQENETKEKVKNRLNIKLLTTDTLIVENFNRSLIVFLEEDNYLKENFRILKEENLKMIVGIEEIMERVKEDFLETTNSISIIGDDTKRHSFVMKLYNEKLKIALYNKTAKIIILIDNFRDTLQSTQSIPIHISVYMAVSFFLSLSFILSKHFYLKYLK